MTVFNDGNNQNVESNQTKDESNQSYVEKLVKERGDHWKDPEVIAKGKWESDEYIKKLKADLEAAQKAVGEGQKVEDILRKIEEKAAQSASANTQSKDDGGATDSDTKNSVSEQDIQSLVEKVLTKRESENSVSKNLEKVNSQLEATFGDEAAEVIQKKSQELGLSMDRLKELASESPTAFFNLIGEKQTSKPSTPVKGTINAENFQSASGKRNWSYYTEMRKKQPTLFNSAENQSKMMADRIAMGSDFYK